MSLFEDEEEELSDIQPEVELDFEADVVPVETPIKKKRKVRNKEAADYVDNKTFANALDAWVVENKNNGKRKNWTPMPTYIGECILKIVDHFALQGSWRSYCVDDQTEALTKRGWLTHDQITEDDIILSYDGNLKWSKIESIFRDTYDGDMFKITSNDSGKICVKNIDALVTPGHKFITYSGLKKAEYLLEKDILILMGDAVQTHDTKIYSDTFVELVGWFVTEGNIYDDKDRTYKRVSIYQNLGVYSQRIEECLRKLESTFGMTLNKNKITYSLPKEIGNELLKVADNKVLSMNFILALTQDQRELLINTMIDGDGWRNGNSLRYCQKDKAHVDSFLALCTISGMKVSYVLRDIISYGKPTQIYTMNIYSKRRNVSQVENMNFHGGKRNNIGFIGKDKFYYPNFPTVPYKGIVWCPKTEYGSFMCRRNGTIYLTGNTYLDEMKDEARMNLIKGVHNFNINKGTNAFAYASEIVRKSFIFIKDKEAHQTDIRTEHINRTSVYSTEKISLYDSEEA